LLAELKPFVDAAVFGTAPAPSVVLAVTTFVTDHATTAHKTAVATDHAHAMDATLALLVKATTLTRAVSVRRKLAK
jgi:hypothetical protein